MHLLRWSGVRSERDAVARQAEPRSGDEAAQLPSNLSGRAKLTRKLNYLAVFELFRFWGAVPPIPSLCHPGNSEVSSFIRQFALTFPAQINTLLAYSGID